MEKLYTEKELLEYLKRPGNKRQGVDRLVTMCRQAGLIIVPVGDTMRGKGSQILYRIIEDNYMLPNEIWVNVYCSNNHEVSNYGRIRQKDTKRLMGSKMDNGYIMVGFGQHRNIRAHRVVFFSFHPEYLDVQDKIVIDHINGKRDDNRLENLRPISNLENVQKGNKNQTECQTIVAQLLLKFGYEGTKQKLQELLNSENAETSSFRSE